jgi:hypothetical protein
MNAAVVAIRPRKRGDNRLQSDPIRDARPAFRARLDSAKFAKDFESKRNFRCGLRRSNFWIELTGLHASSVLD